MCACQRIFRFRWWLFFVAITDYNYSVVAQTTIQPLNLQVLVGENASFECKSAENGDWYWYKVDLNPLSKQLLWKEGANINMHYNYIFMVYGRQGENSRFTILNTTLDDDQTKYYCKLGSQSNNATLEVIEGTKLGQSYPQCEANFTVLNIKNEVTMTCRASGGDPRPSLQWYRNGEILTKQNDTSSRTYGNISYFDSLIRQMTAEDETAVFTCRAEGPAVEGNQNCSISVATPPTVTIIANKTYFNSGDSLEFSCIVMSPWNIVDYKWTVTNRSLMSSNAIFKNDNRTIILSNLQSQDAGTEIGCNVMTSSGLNGNDSVTISLFDIDEKNNKFPLTTIVVGGVIALVLLCVTLFLLIRQRQKRKRTNKTVVSRKTSTAQCAPLDGQECCISEENSAYHCKNASFPLSEHPTRFHHYDDHINVNGDQENVSSERPSIGIAKCLNTASLGSNKRVADLELLDSNRKHISHKYTHAAGKNYHGFDDMYAHPFTETQKPDTKSNDEPIDNGHIYAKPRKGAQSPDTQSFDGIVDLGDLYAKPVKEKQKSDTRSIDGITDFGGLYAKPIKNRKSIHQSLEDIAATFKGAISPNRSGSTDNLYAQPKKNHASSQPRQTEHYAKPRCIAKNITTNMDANTTTPFISNDPVQNISNINKEDFTYSSIV